LVEKKSLGRRDAVHGHDAARGVRLSDHVLGHAPTRRRSTLATRAEARGASAEPTPRGVVERGKARSRTAERQTFVAVATSHSPRRRIDAAGAAGRRIAQRSATLGVCLTLASSFLGRGRVGGTSCSDSRTWYGSRTRDSQIKGLVL
jgi:hypothetical protein